MPSLALSFFPYGLTLLSIFGWVQILVCLWVGKSVRSQGWVCRCGGRATVSHVNFIFLKLALDHCHHWDFLPWSVDVSLLTLLPAGNLVHSIWFLLRSVHRYNVPVLQLTASLVKIKILCCLIHNKISINAEISSCYINDYTDERMKEKCLLSRPWNIRE